MVEVLRRTHDMGGLEGGALDFEDHAREPWEIKVNALLRLLVSRKIMTLDELRRGIEEIGPDVYDRYSYYERWIASISNILLEKGVLEVAELGAAMDAARRRHGGA